MDNRKSERLALSHSGRQRAVSASLDDLHLGGTSVSRFGARTTPGSEVSDVQERKKRFSAGEDCTGGAKS